MKFNYIDTLLALSYALDCVEHDLLGVATHHSKRVAIISIKIAEFFGLTNDQKLDLLTCAILHDNALTQYIQSEYKNYAFIRENKVTVIPAEHCIEGEKNAKLMIFHGDVTNSILYHHENADGTGALGKKANEIPLFSRIIHIADNIDRKFNLSIMSDLKCSMVNSYISENIDTVFDREIAEIALSVLNCETLKLLRNDNIDTLIAENVNSTYYECKEEELMNFAKLFAKIVDYKSNFTMHHSIGIAEKALAMGKYYNYDSETCAKMYFAGAVHDIGKLIIDRDILEKPDKLSETEFKHVQTHAYATYDMLSKIKGMEDVTDWASFHHEKLDGSGYPFGKKAEDLNKIERLMTCLDIYQALTETRPYKECMNHDEAMNILYDMALDNKIDGTIVDDIDCIFKYSLYGAK